MPATAAERDAFHAVIRRLIEGEKRMTRAQLAEAVGVSRQIVGEYVAGKKAPGGRDLATQIDAALGADGAILSALGYADRRPTLEERITRIEEHLGLDAFTVRNEQFAAAASGGRPRGKGRKVASPRGHVAPESEGP